MTGVTAAPTRDLPGPLCSELTWDEGGTMFLGGLEGLGAPGPAGSALGGVCCWRGYTFPYPWALQQQAKCAGLLDFRSLF